MNQTTEIHNHCRNYLPHIENQRFQMITYRLYDSVPKSVIERWKGAQTARLQNNGMQTARLQKADEPSALHNSSANSEKADEPSALQRQMLVKIDKFEDSGYGQCFMRDDRVAQILKDNMMYPNGKLYHLLAWCIMPNHVHTLVEMFRGVSLSRVMQSWRSYTAHQINRLLNRTGQVWMQEYFDRYIRDADHYQKVVNYIHNNPVKAGLVAAPTQYRWSSAWSADGSSA